MYDQPSLELESPSSNNNSLILKTQTIRKKREKYMKITSFQRDKLLESVFFQNKKVKKAASELEINYSSAKTILFLHRKKFKAFLARKSVNTGDALEEKRCLYKTVPQSFIHNKVNIVTMQGGKKMFEKNVIFHGIANPFEKIPASAFNFVKKNKKNDDSQQKIVQNYEFETVKKIFTLLISKFVLKE